MIGNRHRVTLKDISQKTGFAINTVSKALRDASDLSEATKAHIRTVADEMGYIANTSANSLRSGQTHTLALIVGDITNPLFAIIAKEIEAVARSSDYTILVMNTDEDEVNEIRAVRAAISRGVDGVLLFQTMRSREPVELLEHAGVPCVLLHRMYGDQKSDIVMIDEENGGYLAGRRLVERGRRAIVMLAAPAYISSSYLREQGFLRAMKEAGMGDSCRVIHLSSVLDECGEAVRTLMTGKSRPDGLFCFSDLMAFEAARVIRQLGYAVKDDVSLIGFDNIQSKLAVPFELTSITSHKSALARAVMALVLRRISGDYSDYPSKTVIPVHLIERDSV